MGQNITVTAQDNINVIRKFWEAFNRSSLTSLEIMTELMDENVNWEVVPLNIQHRGRDEMRQLIEGAWVHWDGGVGANHECIRQ
jgi:hypothetical protein